MFMKMMNVKAERTDTYEGSSKYLIFYLVGLSKDILARHNMHHSKEQAFTFIMMLIFFRCTVSLNNSTEYTWPTPLTCFHVKEL